MSMANGLADPNTVLTLLNAAVAAWQNALAAQSIESNGKAFRYQNIDSLFNNVERLSLIYNRLTGQQFQFVRGRITGLDPFINSTPNGQ